jgi:hypothetical protein
MFLLPTATISSTTISTHSVSSSEFRSIFDAALIEYERKTKNNLLSHQLTVQLEDCDSPGAILDLLNKQYEFIQSQNDSGSSKQWFNTTVNVLCAVSQTFGQDVGTVNIRIGPVKDLPSNIGLEVFSPAKVIFAGIGVLLVVCCSLGWHSQI